MKRKNLFLNLLLLLVAVLLGSPAAQAQTLYGLYVAGTQVTSANAADVLGDGGKVSYDNATTTLTLNNANINVTGSTLAINNTGIPNFTIKLVGNNTITAETYGIATAAAGYKSATISGTGTLTVTGREGYAIYTHVGSLTIEGGCTVIAKGKTRGIGGCNGSQEVLTIKNSTVKATGTGGGSISYINTLTLTGCNIMSPVGAHFDANKKAVVDINDSLLTAEVWIEPSLKVQDTLVTVANAANVFGDGKVKYDFDTRTLTLKGASISTTTNGNGILSYIDGLKIALEGNNSVTSTNFSAILCFGNTSISGTGSLNAESSSYSGIYSRGDLTIEGGCTVTAKGKTYGISGTAGANTLTIDSSTVRTTGTQSGSISGIKALTLTRCGITSPEGARYNATKKGVVDADGEILKSEVVIEPIRLWVKGVLVDGSNADNVLGDSTVHYNTTTKTLTLKNADINVIDGEVQGVHRGIVSDVVGLKIVLEGSNSIAINSQKQSYYAAISCSGNTTISGTGSLTVNSEKTIGILAYRSNLTIEGGCTVTATGKTIGISGNGSTSELTIKSSTVRATGTDNGSIVGFNTFTLSDCVFTLPADAQFDAAKKAVVDGSNNILKTEVVIEPSLYVKGTLVTPANAANVLSDNKISYDFATKTLTLKGASISTTNGNGILSYIDGLKIALEGNNSVTSNISAILCSGNTSISGTGSLNAESSNSSGIYSRSDLTIEGGCTVTAKGGAYGISGTAGANTLTIDSSTVRTTGTSTLGSIYNFKTLNLTRCGITSPEGAHFDTTKRSVVSADGEILKTEVKIEPIKLWVKGVLVDGSNADNVLGDSTVRYNTTTKTLTLKNADISATDSCGIKSYINGLKIVLEGSNTVASAGQNAILFMGGGSASISGTGSLTASSGTYAGIFANAGNLIIEGGCTVTATGKTNGICGDNSNSELAINSSTVRATGTENGSIVGFKTFTPVSCVITSPGGARFDTGRKAVVDDASSSILKTEVVIEPSLYVRGTLVTPSNAANVLGNNKISYDFATKTLTLNGATIYVGSSEASFTAPAAIQSNVVGLNIALKGKNTIVNDKSYVAISNGYKTTISGTSADTLVATGSMGGIVGFDSLTIEGGCTVIAKGGSYGISGNGSNPGVLTIKNCIVKASTTATSSVPGSICNFANLTLEGCGILSPEGAHLDSTKNAVVDADDEILKTEVVIEPQFTLKYSAGVGGTIVSGDTVQTVFIGRDGSQVIALANTGYQFTQWSDGKTQNPRTDTNVTDNISVIAEFEAIPYNVTCAAVTNGTLTTTPSGSATVGTEVTITATPETGYRLQEGSLKAYKTGDESVEITITNDKFTMPAHNVTVTCEFEPNTGIDDNTAATVSAYPNPFTNYVVIESEDPIRSVEFINTVGKTVLHVSIPQAQISTQNLLPGVYMVKIDFAKGKPVIVRMVKQ